LTHPILPDDAREQSGRAVRPMAFLVVGVVAGTTAALTNIEGRAIEATLDCAACSGTCQLAAASVVTVSEELTGRCFFYPFEGREEADRHFDSMRMRIFSRVMFMYRDGLLEEIRCRGSARPYNTIRRAARRLELWGKVFVQRGTLGLASLHFMSDASAAISFESDLCSEWRLDDGSRLPARKPFQATSYDPDVRTFRGTMNWHPTTFCGSQLWEYELTFDEAMSRVVDGQMQAHTPGLTDKGLDGQVVVFGEKFNPDAGVMSYERLH